MNRKTNKTCYKMDPLCTEIPNPKYGCPHKNNVNKIYKLTHK